MSTITVRVAIATSLTAVALALPATASASPTPDMCYQYPNDTNTCHVDADGPFSSIVIAYPAHTAAQNDIAAYLNTIMEQYENLRRDIPGAAQQSSGLTVKGSTLTGPTTTSVVLHVVQNIGGTAHPNDWYKAFTFTTDSGAPVTFEQLFRPDTTPPATLQPLVAADLTRQFGQPIDIPPSSGLDPKNYQNFALTDDAVVFYFDRDAFMGGLSSASVSVPRNTIDSLLTPGL